MADRFAAEGLPTGSSQLDEPGLRSASEADTKPLASTLAEAFYDDPVFCWLMPRDATRLGRLRRFFAIELLHRRPAPTEGSFETTRP